MKKPVKYVFKKEKITFRIIDGEAVILNLETGDYYSLNKEGTFIWKALINGKSAQEIDILLRNKYDPKNLQITEDLNSFINELCDENLIEIK